jgi:hypothetical protein
MERRDARARFYSPKAVPRKEREGFGREDSVGGYDGKKSNSRRGKEEDVT